MPMNWTAEAEIKLFVAIIEAVDIKFSEDLLDRLAKIMGPDCTPTAIRHHIHHIKKRVPKNPNSNSTLTTPAKASKPKPATSSRKPKSTAAAPRTLAASSKERPFPPATPKNSKKRTANANGTANGTAKRVRQTSAPVEELLADYKDGSAYNKLYGSGVKDQDEVKIVKCEPLTEFEGIYDEAEDQLRLELDGAREVV